MAKEEKQERKKKIKYDQWLTKDGIIMLEGWARNGLTDDQIAEKCGITRATLYEWKKRFPIFADALKRGKELVDLLVEDSLLKKALGFTKTVNKTYKLKDVQYNNGKRLSETERLETVQEEIYIPPETIAMIYWLKNRKPQEWRDKVTQDKNDEIVNRLLEALGATKHNLNGETNDRTDK